MTDDERHLPPAGWYADPEVPGELRFWDGRAWGERFRSSAPAMRPERVARPVGRGFGRLASVIGVLLVLVLVVLVSKVVLYTWGFLMVDGALQRGDLNALDTFDGMDLMLSIALLVGLLVTGVCWMTWQYQLSRSAQPGELVRSPGMHAFSWIIPVGAIWLPYQNVRDLWRVYVPAGVSGLLGLWWAGWLLGLLLDRLKAAQYHGVNSVSTFQSAMLVQILTAGIGIVTTVLAIRIIRLLTAGGLARSASVSPGGTSGAW